MIPREASNQQKELKKNIVRKNWFAPLRISVWVVPIIAISHITKIINKFPKTFFEELKVYKMRVVIIPLFQFARTLAKLLKQRVLEQSLAEIHPSFI